jgi:hypothetical protein
MKAPKTKIPAPPGPDTPCEEIDEYFSKYSWSDLEKAGRMRPLTKKETAELNRFTKGLKQQQSSAFQKKARKHRAS